MSDEPASGSRDGPPGSRLRYAARTSWPLPAAVLAALALIVGALVVAATVGQVSAGEASPSEAGSLVLFQLLVALGVVGLAQARDGDAASVLALRRPRQGAGDFGRAVVALAAVGGFFITVVSATAPAALERDMSLANALLSGPDRPLALFAVLVGAPLAEELLFRGFLFSAVAKQLGLASAAILTSLAWTALHIGYSAWGLFEVFIVGLVLSWLLVRTGSLWLLIACHALNNLVVTFVVMPLLLRS